MSACRQFAWLSIATLLLVLEVHAEVRVTASVDRNRMALGESIQFTLRVEGTRSNPAPAIPSTPGLSFAGPSTFSNVSIVNGQMSQSVNLVYQVSAAQVGAYTIPSATVTVDGQAYRTPPIPITVEKNPVIEALSERLFARVKFDAAKVYVGQTLPLDVYLFAREDVPIRGVSGFQVTADGLDYKHLSQLKQGTHTSEGQAYRVFVIEGSISPTTPGRLTFGPAVIKAQLALRHQRSRGPGFGDSIFDQMMGNIQMQEMPVETEPLTIEVLPLPTTGQPAGFDGAVGTWTLEVDAKPTSVAVGDPVTLTIKISGQGNIDTVPSPTLGNLDQFKTYEPTAQTTKNELGTEGARTIQQVLIPKTTAATSIPAVGLVFFNPITGDFETLIQPPIPLTITGGTTNATTVVATDRGSRRPERLGQDIVYLKGNRGPAVPDRPFVFTAGFWILNLLPIGLLAGGLGWKARHDRLRRDVAYARRSRAARQAWRLLDDARTYDQAQQALQQYLGDRLNIPISGITASIAEEHLIPRGADPELAKQVRHSFETCDQARFAGDGAMARSLPETIAEIRHLVSQLESTSLKPHA